ncbi:hypothetical protein [Cupriavidus plantarum]|uniref:hypothetical protein n=1 Tax=Cupriavidus plantarum TaxID=942865 RepID=UPI001B211D0A|nr:hypothetical protein [Cupriavidus plantarum]CAG2127969.1 hypothetical protein LMG26296_01015 [Cupriavidus plantarum]SMR66853.1 hypothetical protein SAMN05421735_1743 [Cupriavidus plantarum]
MFPRPVLHRYIPTVFSLLFLLFLLLAASMARGSEAPLEQSVAFYAGTAPPSELKAFDTVVVPPDTPLPARAPGARQPLWAAWLRDPAVVPATDDPQTATAYVEDIVAPLWQKGFRGFYLDQPVTEQKAGPPMPLVALIHAIHLRYPEAKLLVRDDSGVVEQTRSELFAVVMSRSQGTEARARAAELRRDTSLMVVMTDACPAAARGCMRDSALRMLRDGVVPYVADPDFLSVGIGRVEVMPRRILIVQNRASNVSIDSSKGVRYLSMPLNYLGYRVEFAEASGPLPDIGADRYAGVVLWFDGPLEANAPNLYRWVQQNIGRNIPIAIFNDFGVDMRGQPGRILGLRKGRTTSNDKLETVSQDPMMGFEVPVTHDNRIFDPIQAGPGSEPLLRVRGSAGTYDPVAITPWGGYVLRPYAVLHDFRELDNDRWVVQPIAFLQRALRLPYMPVPDTTSENGRRLLTVHVDGDGFASRAEMPGGGFAGEVLLREIFDRYRLPVTMSIIEGELSADGMYPQLSPALEPIARQIFARPYVEIASHTYSHPFFWRRTVSPPRAGEDTTPYHLPIPGYRLSLEREINGTIDYINTRLAPPNKKVRLVLWPGDTQIPVEVLRMTNRANVMNLNGGDTIITRSNDSWTAIGPLGVWKTDDTFQVFAPNQNENIYTNLWKGPYYGFRRVKETFELTEHPLRFKPINIYFHSYSGTKVASLKALKEVFDYALSQPTLPLHSTDYIARVMDAQDLVIAHTVADTDGTRHWIVRGGGAVRNLRWDGPGRVNLGAAHGAYGVSAAPGGGTYVFTDGQDIGFSTSSQPDGSLVPYVAEANAVVGNWTTDGTGVSFDFAGYRRPWVKLRGARGCAVTLNHVAQKRSATPDDMVLISGDPTFDLRSAPQHVEVRCQNR